MPVRRTKSLDPEENAAVRVVVRELVDGQFKGNILAASKELRVAYATLYNLYEGTGGAGVRTLQALARYTKTSIEALLGEAARGPLPASAVGAREQWSGIRRELEARMGYVQPEALAAALDQVAASSMSARPKQLTADWVQPFVEAYLKVNAHELRSENERIRAEMAADDAKGRR